MSGLSRQAGALRAEAMRTCASIKPITPEIIEGARARLLAYIPQGDPDECWIWSGPLAPKGYGVLKVLGSRWQATRLQLASLGHEVPTNLFVCHRCDNPPCCNPSHLFLGTLQDNTRDAVAKGRMPGWSGNRVGEANPNAKLTAVEVAEIRRQLARGDKQVNIARRFSISPQRICLIAKGVAWK